MTNNLIKFFKKEGDLIMATTKVTKKDMFNEIIALATTNDRQDIIDFAKKEIELLNKRATTETKADKEKKAEKERLTESIIELLTNTNEAYTTMDIATKVGISPQKTTPIMAALLLENKVKFEIKKGKKYYSLV